MPDITLGKTSLYPDTYDSTLLAPIPRSMSRNELIIGDQLPFDGYDLWTAYELSWLDNCGKPISAIGEFKFGHDTHAIIESKSFKYYLNSFNQTRFDSAEEVKSRMQQDLKETAGGCVEVVIAPLGKGWGMEFCSLRDLPGTCVDNLHIGEVSQYSPSPGLLDIDNRQVRNQAIYSHLLKSNCPVTGQPDWASVWVEYSGREILPGSFLKYVISFRQHQDFHENCVEKIFLDITQQCNPTELSVYARYTRRGGLDINPFRSNCRALAPATRLARQ